MNTEITEFTKAKGWIFYDADCRFCTALVRRFEPSLASRRFELLPLQTPGLADRLHLSNSQLMDEMRLLRPDGECLRGADALLEIARDFWWSRPLWQLGRIPAIRSILRAGYRWVAQNRSCASGGCEVPPVLRRAWQAGAAATPPYHAEVDPVKNLKRTIRSRVVDFLPLLVLPGAALLFKGLLVPWVFMWAMAFALYGGCKWLTYREAVHSGLRPGLARTTAYLLAWPGMDASAFLETKQVPAKPKAAEWLFATAKMSAGVIFLWLITRLLLPQHPMLAGWAGMTGVVFILHFGLFHLFSLFWRRMGIPATPVMQNPLRATSLAEFWGRRWNTAFNELAFRFTFRPLRRVTTPVTAMLLVFGLSGLVHELVISLPAGGGYGLPTVYFLIQGFGTVIERSRFGRAIGLGRGACGWFFTLFITVAPIFLLFHPPFITHIILPMLNAIGAT